MALIHFLSTEKHVSEVNANDEFVKFWKVLCSHKMISTEKNGERYLKLNNNVPWLSGLTCLYVRKCYVDLAKMFLDDKIRNALLLGTPGIGKSLFMRWLIATLVRENIDDNE